MPCTYEQAEEHGEEVEDLGACIADTLLRVDKKAVSRTGQRHFKNRQAVAWRPRTESQGYKWPHKHKGIAARMRMQSVTHRAPP